MPNWCYNTLKVDGDKDEVFKFKVKAKAKDTDLSLAKFIPLPDELKNTDSPATIVSEKDYEAEVKKTKIANKKGGNAFKRALPITQKMSDDLKEKYGADNWYDWQVAHWGTKWDVDAQLVDEDEGYLEYTFDSAWSPPAEWLREVAQKYPTLHFTMKYEEEGMGFFGRIKAHGENFNDQCLDN